MCNKTKYTITFEIKGKSYSREYDCSHNYNNDTQEELLNDFIRVLLESYIKNEHKSLHNSVIISNIQLCKEGITNPIYEKEHITIQI